jgi:hypothetical protein
MSYRRCAGSAVRCHIEADVKREAAMTYAYTMDVPQPIEMYDKVRAELEKRLGRSIPEGCLLHLAVKTDTGFRVTEVWESHEAVDRFGDEVMRPIIAGVMGVPEAELEQNPPPNQEIDLHHLEVDVQALASV